MRFLVLVLLVWSMVLPPVAGMAGNQVRLSFGDDAGAAYSVRAEMLGLGIALASLGAPEPQWATDVPAPTRCTSDGTGCIRLSHYIDDVCRAIETSALANALDPNFFARLIWKESLFDASAVSPAGALGIAQFMPGTAVLRGLADPFNPADALAASAHYLAEMTAGYGNLGLAAVAYNGGEARAERFIAGAGGLALETRAYVQAITGHSAEIWRDAPPATLDLTLAPGEPFRPACIRLAANRSLKEFRSTPPVLPWGVILASHRDREGAERQFGRLQNRFASVLRGETVTYTRDRIAGMPRQMHMAQIGRNTRGAADALCASLRASGGDCIVLRN